MTVDTSQSSHPLAGKRIIVAGGGIAGLSFVRALSRYWPHDVPRPHISVYERDPRQLPPGRGSYSLGIRSDSRSGGMQALVKLGLWDEIFGARTEGSEFGVLIMDNKWNTIMKGKQPTTPPDGLPVSQLRITRSDLRECLIGGVPDDVEMHWANGCISAAQTKKGLMEVRLQDGSTAECDLLIVADGASSKVRASLRPDDKLNYAGAVMVGGNAYFKEDEVPQKLQEGHGVIFGGDGHGLIVFPIENGNFVWFVTRRSATPRTPTKNTDDPQIQQEIIDEALREGKVFAEPFPTLIAHTDRATLKTFSAQDKPSISHTETPGLPYIFIGDANHAMSPFGGNGANFALMDGISLARSLVDSPSIDTAKKEFDAESMPRCAKSLKISRNVIWLGHSTGLLFKLAIWFLWFINWMVR